MAQQEQGRTDMAGGQSKEIPVTHGFATDYNEEHHVAARHRHDREQQRHGRQWQEMGDSRSLLGAVAGIAALAIAGAAYAAYRRQGSRSTDAFGNLEIDENDRLISSSKVEDTAVYDMEGERLGTIRNFMVDKYSGQVRYAVLSFGGMMGLGERHYPLPWDVLTYDEDMGGYVVDLDKETLEGAPSHEASQEPDFNSTYRRQILLFYRP